MDARGGAAMPGDGRAHGCPFHGQSDVFQNWLDSGLLCSAGKREFKLDRYQVSQIGTGEDFARELEFFRREVIAYEKTGFLAILNADTSSCRMVEDELWLLGKIVRDAGLVPSVAALITGETLAIPFQLACPVTGEETIYEFFPVAFTRNASNPDDPLCDPSLSAPFTAINTTSDAFAFALLVRELAQKLLGCVPFEATDRERLAEVMERAVTVWQNMSIKTMLGYNRVSTCPARSVHLSEDRRFWLAPHNDPVFGELEKHEHAHEMPSIYAARLCERWKTVIFDDKPQVPSRDGQSGGWLIEAPPEVLDELHQL
jgi:hypothetical protein